MIRTFGGKAPRLGTSAYVDPSAQVIGDVDLGARSSIWMNAVVRADVHWIRIGAESNIQDLCVLHVFKDRFPLSLGSRVTVGHSVTLHGCAVGDDCLIGMGAVLLDGCEVGEGSLVAAGSLVPPGMKVPPGSLVMGSPARVRRAVSDEERVLVRMSAENYVEYAAKYLAEGAR